MLSSEERYSFTFGGTAQALDHALLNPSADMLLSNVQYVRGNVDSPFKYRFDYTQANSISDHDGLIINLELIDANELIFRAGFN